MVKHPQPHARTAAIRSYLVLIRGVNVGGKNKLPMAVLRTSLADAGFAGVRTYIASGNVLLQSHVPAQKVKARVERLISSEFDLDDPTIQVVVLDREQFRTVIEKKPAGFGEQPDKYHSDAIFLMGIEPADAMAVFDPREGVDQVWPGAGVIYSQRLSAERTRSRLSRIVGTPAYRSMTIRSWNTTTALWKLLQESEPS